MQNKPAYFKPDISDFWHGVTFFMANAKSDFTQPPETWGLIRMNYIIGVDYFLDRSDRKHLSVGDFLFMKYLTADDIELNGWARVNNPPIIYQQSMNSPIVIWFNLGKWFISFAEETRMLGVYEQSEEFRTTALHASCYCRDVNRFLLLVKMVIADLEQQRELNAPNIDTKRLSQ